MAMPEEVERETLDFSQLMIHMGIGWDALKKLIEAGGMPEIQYGESRYITPIRARRPGRMNLDGWPRGNTCNP